MPLVIFDALTLSLLIKFMRISIKFLTQLWMSLLTDLRPRVILKQITDLMRDEWHVFFINILINDAKIKGKKSYSEDSLA